MYLAHDVDCDDDNCTQEPADIGCGDADELATEYERLISAQ